LGSALVRWAVDNISRISTIKNNSFNTGKRDKSFALGAANQRLPGLTRQTDRRCGKARP